MIYHILHWQPEQRMNGAGFSIALFDKWKEQITISNIKQENINLMLERYAPYILEGHGYDKSIYNAGDIRVTWGVWGPEHITVPGNACGLDISHAYGFGDKLLTPHNVDSLKQASMLLTVFLKIADLVANKIVLD